MEKCFSLEDLNQIACLDILPKLKKKHIITLEGPLGVGKTTLVKEVLKQCGVVGVVKSPTFTYINSYKGNSEIVFNHFDLYRVDSLEMFVDAGFEEYLYNDNMVNFIEWPDVIACLLRGPDIKKKVLKLILNYHPSDRNKRVIQFK